MSAHRRAGGSGGAGLLLVATGLTGAANYGLSLVLVHLLTPGEFSRFAAASTLLLTVGTVAGAAGPWVMAREAALSRAGDPRRRLAIRFGLGASLALGLVAALAVTAASASYAGAGLLVGESFAAILILLCAVGAGSCRANGPSRRWPGSGSSRSSCGSRWECSPPWPAGAAPV